uniref:PDZ domain-containing protein n=1 Tax=Rhabditophanes sp. KR3021 TaxID=114890 RepID=A0AC35TSP7_9BILA
MIDNTLNGSKQVQADSSSSHRRQTLLLKRSKKDSFGFTIQSYLLKRSGFSDVEPITFVDSIKPNSPAAKAGLVSGSVIYAINGQICIDYSHEQLRDLIMSLTEMMIVVLFENMQKRIELAKRRNELDLLLQAKLKELAEIEEYEKSNFVGVETHFEYSDSRMSMCSNESSGKDSAIGSSIRSETISTTSAHTSSSSLPSVNSSHKTSVLSVTEEDITSTEPKTTNLVIEDASDEISV